MIISGLFDNTPPIHDLPGDEHKQLHSSMLVVTGITWAPSGSLKHLLSSWAPFQTCVWSLTNLGFSAKALIELPHEVHWIIQHRKRQGCQELRLSVDFQYFVTHAVYLRLGRWNNARYYLVSIWTNPQQRTNGLERFLQRKCDVRSILIMQKEVEISKRNSWCFSVNWVRCLAVTE